MKVVLRLGIIAYSLLLFLLPSNTSLAQQVTYYEDIAPIIIKNCMGCHRDGEVAPFPLTSYEEVSAKAKLVKTVTKSRFMPPWLADNSFQQYSNDRSLTQDEIDLIGKWVDGGKLKGNPANEPEKPIYQRNSLINRKPDLTIRMREPVFIPGNNKEHFVAIKIPVEIDEGKFVECIEFVPDNRKICHHSNFSIIKPERQNCMYEGGFVRHSMYHDSKDTWKIMNMVPNNGTTLESFFFSGWVPGASPPIYPGDLGVYLPKKFILLIDAMHYAGSPVDTWDYSSVNIFYKDKPAERSITFYNIGSGKHPIQPELFIPANKTGEYNTGMIVEFDLSVLYVMGHMHLIGTKFESIAVTPLGDTINILKINDWDINWQEYYQFNPMLKIPKGSKLMIRGTYDNTVNNPSNPFNPPKNIRSQGNMETTSEMLNLLMIGMPYEKGDETKILK